MQIIEIEFTARRYHATPWDAHVNEGRVEWPPCPWRILRALIAVGHNKLGWNSKIPETAIAIIGKLAACEPRVSLPEAVESHTRHYMPVREGSKEKKAKIFDAFLRFPSDSKSLLLAYDCDLDSDEREMLQHLVEGLAYLGRAESWVDARLLDADESQGIREEIESENNRWATVAQPGDTADRIRLLAPMDVGAFDEWRSESVDKAIKSAELALQAEKGKSLTTKQKSKTSEPYPVDLMAALQNDTSRWQKQGWPRPPGSRWVDYSLPENLFERRPLQPLPANPAFKNPTAILLAIDGEGKRGTLRPLMKRTLPLMELLHAKAIWCADKKLGLNLASMSELTGKDGRNRQLAGPHEHAHWLPLSLLGNGKIDHALVWSSAGFSKESLRAISQIRTAYSKGLSRLGVNMVGQGSIAEMYGQLSRRAQVSQSALDILKPSHVFESATPLVLRKYESNRGKKRPEWQIREELAERGLPDPVKIEIWSQEKLVNRKLKGFVLRRKSGKPQPRFERTWGFTLFFEDLVTHCPITLGYASHFGLGLFRAVDRDF